jgi:alpha-mannosidase
MTFRYFVTSGRTLEPGELARFDAETRPLVVGYLYDIWTRWFRQGLKPEGRRMPPAAGSFFSIDAPHAQVSTLKQAEDGNGYILRLRETAGRGGTARLTSPQVPLTGAFLCNGVEDNLSSLETAGSAVQVPLRPNAFTTVRLVF